MKYLPYRFLDRSEARWRDAEAGEARAQLRGDIPIPRACQLREE